jgi:hypothetical protein
MVAAPRHATLTAGVVTTLDMGGDFETVEVTNVDGAAAIYFTTNGSTPAVEGTGSHVVVAGVGAFTEQTPGRGDAVTIVKLISAGGPKVSVRAW